MHYSTLKTKLEYVVSIWDTALPGKPWLTHYFGVAAFISFLNI